MKKKRNTIVARPEHPTDSRRNLSGEYWEKTYRTGFPYVIYSFEASLEGYEIRPPLKEEYKAGSPARDHFGDFLIDELDERPLLIYSEAGKRQWYCRVLNMERMALAVSHKADTILYLREHELFSGEKPRYRYHLVKKNGSTLHRPLYLASHQYRQRRAFHPSPASRMVHDHLAIRIRMFDEWEKLFNRYILFFTGGDRPDMQVLSMLHPKKVICVESFAAFSPVT